MSKKLILTFSIFVFTFGFINLFGQKVSSSKEFSVLDGEKWWGGAVRDGRLMPFGEADYSFNHYGNVGANQAQPLFVSSKGRYIWSNEPLNIHLEKGKISVGTYNDDSLIVSKAGKTLREVFQFVSKKYFPPTGKTPDSLLFVKPQYNTWIELQYNQNEKDILKYAESIAQYGFPTGVIMIDDNWQVDYGTWEFSAERFSNPKAMVDKLHALGFKVMLWVCPFISPDSWVYRNLARQKLLVFENKEKTKPAIIKWWNGQSAAIDLTNPDGMKWYKDQLANLASKYGVDGFKLDAGDAEFYSNIYSFKTVSPNVHCELHAQVGLDFPLNEYRACWKMAGQPLVQRLCDKEHRWSDVQALIPDMVVQGLLGYSFGCPDMIGGGDVVSFRDSSVLDEELVVRSAQVSALMPMMQFSVAPWRILKSENLEICKKMALLHTKMGSEIMKIAQKSATTGEPIIRNLEYVFPENGYENIKDQFMLGDKILVAPVLVKGQRSRIVAFPKGKWQGEDGSVVKGPIKIEIKVPLERLPWYRKI